MAVTPIPIDNLETLRLLWAQVLDEEARFIKNDDNFFDRGGDSLTASNLIDAAEEHGLAITVEELFTNPSLESLASCISSTRSTSPVSEPSSLPPFATVSRLLATSEHIRGLKDDAAAKCGIEPDDIEDAYPCTPLQAAMFTSSLAGSDSYLHQIVYRYDQRHSAQQLQTVWQSLSNKHPILRTRIVQNQHLGLVQVVLGRSGIVNILRGTLESCLSQDLKQDRGEGDPLFQASIVLEPDASDALNLVITWHHAIMDAAAWRLVTQDALQFDSLSGADISGIGFSSFIDQLVSADPASSDQFWTSQLQRAEPNMFPKTQSAGPFSSRSLFETRFEAPLSNLSGITPALALRAAWALLLAHRTGNEDVVFAATLDGRSSPHARDVIGPLITVVPVRIVLDLDKTVVQFFDQVREQAAAMMPHHHYGFQNIRQRLGADGQCIGQINNLLLVQAPGSAAMAADMMAKGIQEVHNVGKPLVYDFALVNEVLFDSESVTLQLRYDDRYVDTNLVRSLASQFQQIMHQLCKRPHEPLKSLHYLSQDDISTLATWNSEYEAGTTKTCVELFLEQSTQRQDAQAVCSWDGTLTFGELAALSSRFAHHLCSINVRPGSLVALCSEKSKWAVVSILGILMAGAAWIPLDINHPDDRISEVLSLAKVDTIVASQGQEARMNQHMKTVIVTEQVLQGQQDMSYPNSPIPVSTKSLAYVLFTSGSTGVPKGVMISHGALSNAIKRQGQALGCKSSWRSFQFSSHTFDPSISESLQVLCHGGVVCVPNETERLENLSAAIKSLDANCVQLTPSVLSTLRPHQVPSVKTVILVGEPSKQALISLWAPRVELINAYGPTEACIYCTVARPLKESDAPSLVGRQCGGTTWIVNPDDYESLLPIGFVGEIVCSGPSLADGYLNNREAMRAAFVECHWLRQMQPSSPSRLIYKTGDLGYYDTDGTIHLIGRKDSQVKLRGNRIELGEIENRLSRELEGAAISVVLPTSGVLKGQLVCLVCFGGITTSQDQCVSADIYVESDLDHIQKMTDLYRRLSSKVPSYMVPAYWGAVSQLPLNRSGKLDRKALRLFLASADDTLRSNLARVAENALIEDHEQDSSHKVAFIPITVAEKKLELTMRGRWAAALKIAPGLVKDTSSFFQMGGDSLAVINLVSACREAGINVSIEDVLQSRTFGRLCQQVCTHLNGSRREQQETMIEPFPLTPRQLQLVGGTVGAKTDGWRTGRRVQLRSDIPIDRIKQASDNLVSVHPICRARLDQRTRRIKLSEKLDDYRFQACLYCNINQDDITQIEQTALEALNFKDGPSFSVDVYRSNDCIWLFLAALDLLLDSTSWTILLRDLDAALSERLAPAHPPYGIWDICKTRDLPGIPEEPAGDQYNENAKSCNWVPFKYSSVSSSTPISEIVTNPDLYQLEDVAESSILHALETFMIKSGCVSDGTSVSIRFCTERLSGFERAIGNFEGAALTFDLAAFRGDSNLCDARRTIRWALAENAWNNPTHQLEQSKAVGSAASNLELLVILHSEEKEGQTWTMFETVEDSHSRLGHDSDSSGRYIQLTLLISPKRIQALCLFSNQDEKSGDVPGWVKQLWKGTMLEPFKGSTSLAQMGFVSGICLDTDDTDALLQELDDQISDLYAASPMQNLMHSTYTTGFGEFELQYNFELSSSSKKLGAARVEEAWNRLVSRHAILRTRLALTPKSRQSITRSPSFVTTEMEDGSIACTLVIPHALVDGQSMTTLFNELAFEIGNGPSDSKRANIISMPFQKHASKARRESHQIHETYWIEAIFERAGRCILQDAASTGVNDTHQAHQTQIEKLDLPSISLRSRKALQAGTSVAAILDVAWAFVLEKYTGSKAPAFGAIVSDRTLPSHDSAIGPYINFLATYVDLSGTRGLNQPSSREDVLQGVQKQRLQSLSHAAGCLSAARKCGISMTDKSFFNTAINFQKNGRTTHTSSDVTVKLVDLIDPWPVDIMVRALEVSDHLKIRLEYRLPQISRDFVTSIGSLLIKNVEMLMG
ncbi:Nonribosomal peptide synthetase 1 [Cladobotryum mycophilum]|uniref:Nonribosomal peptide synthetase 1 n=1 Tax=Cladobotryum mycophilum TaxID=491253 RepID=A0ABR0SYE1_9HYPO